MKSKKKGHHVRRSSNYDSNSDTKQKNGQNDNSLILGRVSINPRSSPSNALLLGRVLGLDSAHPYMSINLYSLLLICSNTVSLNGILLKRVVI